MTGGGLLENNPDRKSHVIEATATINADVRTAPHKIGKNTAIAELEKARAERALSPTLLRFDPRLDTLRTEPRFQDFLRRVGL